MDKQIIAIGGGGFGRNPGDGVIEQYILDQTGKEKPNICFIWSRYLVFLFLFDQEYTVQ